MTEYLAARLAAKLARFERACTVPRRALLAGRGHCGRCFSPFGCARPADHAEPCGCHVSQRWGCRRPGCAAPLFMVTRTPVDPWLVPDYHLLDEYREAAA